MEQKKNRKYFQKITKRAGREEKCIRSENFLIHLIKKSQDQLDCTLGRKIKKTEDGD